MLMPTACREDTGSQTTPVSVVSDPPDEDISLRGDLWKPGEGRSQNKRREKK